MTISAARGKLTLYYATWCAYSRRLMSVWESIVNKYETSKTIEIVSINCDDATIDGIMAFPTIMFEYDTGEKFEYDGDRSVEAISLFLQDPSNTIIE